MPLGVRGGEAEAQAAGAFGNGGRTDGLHQQAPLPAVPGGVQRARRLAEDDGKNGTAGLGGKPQGPETRREAADVAPEPLPQGLIPLHHVHGGLGGGTEGGGQRGGEDEGAGPVEEQLRHGARGGHVGSHASERLAQGPHAQVHLLAQAQFLAQPGPTGPQHTGGVGLVHHQRGPPLPAEGHQLGQRGMVAIHGKDRVGDDELAARGRLLQRPGQGLDLRVGVNDDAGAGQPAAIHKGGMVEGVGEDGIPGAHQGREDARVGGEAGVEEEDGLGTLKGGQPGLQAPMGHGIPHHQTAGAGAHTVLLEGGGGGGAQRGRSGQAQVIVGREVDEHFSAHAHQRALGGLQRLQGAAQPSRRQGLQVLLGPGRGRPRPCRQGIRLRREAHSRDTSGARGWMPAFSSKAMSRVYSGLPVVSSFSPKKSELAPASMHRSCASSFICMRPADSRTMARGMSRRAVAMVRTISTVSTRFCPANGVPSTATSALMGTDSGWTSWLARVRSSLQRSSRDSPRPMMPPEHTEMPARRTRSRVLSRSS
ncbi:hypothetical protein STIAU_3593 [Stigmatella aurantiaca DW4/3-1]|uniref:Uncharacterized protein n=1 Tax=Stigmatella aurantiaca (strain DW4/3-1) TaxID=378806 RepID=Q092F3_STIAD|nr:hypothetical protein STIAU_3593 [Stigmatella aurantiaca DW4/3-1]